METLGVIKPEVVSFLERIKTKVQFMKKYPLILKASLSTA